MTLSDCLRQAESIPEFYYGLEYWVGEDIYEAYYRAHVALSLMPPQRRIELLHDIVPRSVSGERPDGNIPQAVYDLLRVQQTDAETVLRGFQTCLQRYLPTTLK